MSDGPASGANPRAPRSEDVDLLRARARQLARVTEVESEHGGAPAVAFALGGEHYALDARRVLEVAPLRSFTPLPAAAAPLFGLTYWRGDVLPVVDLRAPLGVRSAGLTDLGRLVVVEHEAGPFGFLADAVLELIELDPSALQPLGGAAEASPLIAGAAGNGVIVIDPAALLRLVAGGR